MRYHDITKDDMKNGDGLRVVLWVAGCGHCCEGCQNPVTWDPEGGLLFDEAAKTEIFEQLDKPYISGITFSGGEPTVQAQRLLPLLRQLRAAGIHICVDSNGAVWNAHVEEMLRLTDLVLLDVKQMNPERHLRLTGRSNEQTLRTAEWLESNGRPFWLRYVLVPGVSDFEDDLHALGRHFAGYSQIDRVELLPYHTLGVHKYEALGWDYALKDVKENTPEQLERAAGILRGYFPQLVVN